MTGDPPDARELLDAVATWLTRELAPALPAGPRFQAMVAAQGLAIAARELAIEPEHAAAGAVATVLREHVRRKLTVARPGHDAGQPGRARSET